MKEELVGSESFRRFEKQILMQVIDSHWKGHLAAMDYLRQSIGLRGYAQKNPKQEYKRESFEMFSEMLEKIKYEVTSLLCKVQIQEPDEVGAVEKQGYQQVENMSFQHEEAEAMHDTNVESETDGEHTPYVRENKKLGRNEPCWCGSGKKFKQCHGKLT